MYAKSMLWFNLRSGSKFFQPVYINFFQPVHFFKPVYYFEPCSFFLATLYWLTTLSEIVVKL